MFPKKFTISTKKAIRQILSH